jgi:hypothetical protein
MAISLIFSAVLYNIGTNQIAQTIHTQSERIYNKFPIFENNTVLHPNLDIADSDHALLVRLALLNLVVFALAALVSYWLARITLEPIEEAHEQQKRFTSDVSHELRTPLTALKMESEVALLNDKPTVKELKETLKSNLEEAQKLEHLINNILRLSRLEANELRQNFGTISSKKVVDEAVKEIKSPAKQRGIEIKKDISDFNFIGDQDSITQMLVIFLDNAIKYSGQSKSVNLSVQVEDNQAVFKVKDHGIGIKKESLNNIFDRFYREESSRYKGDNGHSYGLGLSIAKMIADIHNAVITVTSQEGKGTEVKVTFPINKT